MQTNIEKKLWIKAKRYVGILRLVPFVKMVAVCNNLSFGRVDKKSDIDLFIVADTGRLFIVRTFSTFILHMLGVRRHADKVSGRFCLSFFIDDSFKDLSKIALGTDHYLKLWIRELKPLIDNDYYSIFIKANSWAFSSKVSDKHVLNKTFVLKENFLLAFIKSLLFFLLSGFIGDFLERKLGNWQLKRARLKSGLISDKKGILISPNILKFHNVDRRKYYNKLWEINYGNKDINKADFLPLLE